MTRQILAVLAMGAWFSLVADQSEAQSAASPSPPPSVSPDSPAAADTKEQPSIADDKDAIEAARKWLALLDAGKVGAAWDSSSAHLKSVVTRQKWVTEISKARKPYGKLATRKAEKFARSHSLPGAPEGDYSIIQFESVYANGKKASEQVIWMYEADKVWRVSGYFIR